MKHRVCIYRLFIVFMLALQITACKSASSEKPSADTSTQNIPITRSMAFFTQARSATPENYKRYKADGIFWGHMPHQSIESDEQIERWVRQVERSTRDGKSYIGRGEFDWGWYWMIDFMEDPASNWAMDLDSNYIPWHTAGEYKGHNHNWQSHHGPEFLKFMKFQVDRMLLAPVTQIMFDSQTASHRTLVRGGDFSYYAMKGFREYLKEKYSPPELSDLGIEDIDKFNYREFLIEKGFTLESYIKASKSYGEEIPLYIDFVYFNRESLNEMMEEVFAYIDTKRPGIEIGAVTKIIEPRGWLFTDRLTYIAGEFDHPSDIDESPPYQPIFHYKAVEAANKTMVFFPYPRAFRDLRDRNAPRQARGWIAQAYAMGSIFGIPGNTWIGGRESWNPGWENHADLYAFIDDHSELFDDYKALSNTALVTSSYASLLVDNQYGSKTTHRSIEYLINENISFDLLIFGDPDRPIVPTTGQLENYDVIIRDSDAQYLTSEQNKLLEGVASKVVSIETRGEIDAMLGGKIDVYSEKKLHNELISALPRISPDPDAAYVLHLLNRKYNAEEDKAQLQPGISVKIPEGLYPGSITGAILHMPGKPSIDLTPKTDKQGNVTLDIGTFDSCWGLVELSH